LLGCFWPVSGINSCLNEQTHWIADYQENILFHITNAITGFFNNKSFKALQMTNFDQASID